MVKKTDREKEMAAFEKACQIAVKKQAGNRRLRDEYKTDKKKRARVRKLLIEDLLRVFNHPANPYAGWAASRKRYRDLGYYPEILVTDMFGTHQEFERAAGLRDKRGTSKVKVVTGRLATERNIKEYAQANIEPHYGKWDKATRSKSGVKVVVVGSDFHGQFTDPFAFRVWLDVIKSVSPDGVIFNGDAVDFPKVGRYTQMPGAGSLSLQAELDFVKEEIFRKTLTQAPDAYSMYLIGNHEQRLVRYLADTAPGLADLRCLQWDKLLDLDDLKMELVFGGNWLAPTQGRRTDNIRSTWALLHGCFVVAHGRSIAKNAAEAEIQRYGYSGTSGHTHRPVSWTLPTLAGKHLNWTCTGMMAGFAVGKDYVSTPSAWTMGFSIFTIDPKTATVIPQPVLIYEDFASFNGRVWRPTAAEKRARLKQWGEVS